MKSWRLKIVALTWLHGGHQTAPQYRNTGLLSALAWMNAASTSPLRQAIPASCAASDFSATRCVAAGEAASLVLGLGGVVGSGVLVHAQRASAKAIGSNLIFMASGEPARKNGWQYYAPIAPAGPRERLQRTNTILKSSYSKVRHPLIPAHVSRDNNFVATARVHFTRWPGSRIIQSSTLEARMKRDMRYPKLAAALALAAASAAGLAQTQSHPTS